VSYRARRSWKDLTFARSRDLRSGSRRRGHVRSGSSARGVTAAAFDRVLLLGESPRPRSKSWSCGGGGAASAMAGGGLAFRRRGLRACERGAARLASM
jgi:hypothetical protein